MSPSNSRDQTAGADVAAPETEPISAEQLRAQLTAALTALIPRTVLPGTQVIVSDEQWVAALTPFCTGARRLRLSIEHAILMCKEAWHSIPAVRALPLPAQEVLMSRLVTLCIETYFAFPATPAGD